MKFEELPQSWQREITKLRNDVARYRNERNTLMVAMQAMNGVRKK